MSGPRRITRRRRRGWRMPADAVYVGRPTIWGNPFRVSRSSDFHGLPGSWFVAAEDGTIHHPDQNCERSARARAVELYAAWVRSDKGRVGLERVRTELGGRDLVCWCPGDEPCHADVLLELAGGRLPHPQPAPARSVRRGALSRRSGPTPAVGTADTSDRPPPPAR